MPLLRTPAPRTAPVVVHAVHDRAYPEVAAELGVPVGTVTSRMFHALRGLRAALDPAA